MKKVHEKKFMKTKQLWDPAHVEAQEHHYKSTFDYEMYGDVHQVANFCEIEYNKDLKKNKTPCLAKSRYLRMARFQVVLSITVQAILLLFLTGEVFKKELKPSGRFMTLRLVLVCFMFFLAQAESQSILKTKFLVQAQKIGSFGRFANILRQIMAYITLGTALWQVFSGDPSDPEVNVVSEIMNFAALLIVIEIDDFLMASPGQ